MRFFSKNHSAALCLALPLLLVAVEARAQNLVANGGFETGNYTDWTVALAQSGSVLQVFPQAFAHSGNDAAAFGATGAYQDMISQNLSTIPGGKYLVSFYLNVDGTPNTFTAKFNNMTLLNQNNASTANGYVHYSFLQTAASSSSLLSFGASNAPYYDFLDDVSVTLEQGPRAVAAQLISEMGQNINDFQGVMQGRADGMGTGTVMTTADAREVQVADASGGVGISSFSKPAHYVAWMQGIGDFTDLGSGSDEVRANSGGMAFGLETPVEDENTRLGIAFEYESSVLSVSGTGTGSINTYGVGLYGSHKMDDFVFDGSLLAAYDKTVNQTNNVTDNDSGYGFGASGGVRYPVQLDFATLEPRFGLDYAYNHQGGSNYTDPFIQIVTEGSGQSLLRSKLGASLSRVFEMDDGEKITPDIGATWAYQILNPTAVVNENVPLMGSSFSVSSVNPGRNAAILGAGASYGLFSYGPIAKCDIVAHYDATLSANETSHVVTGGLRLSF